MSAVPNINIPKILTPLLLALCTLLFSCGQGNSGLLLWSHNEASIASGSIVRITGESQINGTYQIRYSDTNALVQNVEIDSWRVETNFETMGLQERQNNYAPFAPYYGESEIQALPIRSEASTSASSDIIYRLKEGERVKILWQSDTTVEVGGLEDYWFEVLTEDGTRGFVYGYRLERQNEAGEIAEERNTTRDANLDRLLTTVWHPEYFQWMIGDNRFNLNTFRSNYRFYHDDASQTFVLRSNDHSVNFEYNEIFRPRYLEYQALGTSLHVIMHSENSIRVQYDFNGQAIARNFLRIDEDINEIIAIERERRAELLNALLERGNRLVSSRFGIISLSNNGRGTWMNYNNLNNSAGLSELPSWFQGNFVLEFPLYLSESLEEDFNGALSLTLADQPISNSINFLYRIQNNNIQLEYIPAINIDDIIVERQARIPLRIQFRISQ